MRTIAEEGRVPSLTPPRIILWLWQSMRPGVTCIPFAPMIMPSKDSGGDSLRPTSTMRPLAMRMEPLVITPSGPHVQIVAF